MMSKRVSYLRSTRNEEAGLMCAAWAPRLRSERDGPSSFVLLGRGQGKEQTEVLNGLAVSEYDFQADTLSDTIQATGTEDGPPLKLAVHPSGDGVICAFADNFKLFEMKIKGKTMKLKASERELLLLRGLGMQSCICFSGDGSLFATGGKDGHLRIFMWPSLQLVLDEPHAHRSIRDLDFSLDSAYLASTAEDDSACRVWEIEKGESVAQLSRDKDERFGYCRFSRDGTKPFLFLSYTKGKKGYIGVWNLSDWSKVGYKKFSDVPISAFAVTRDGKFLGIGTIEGDVSVIGVTKMEATQHIGSAHIAPVTVLEFSKHRRALLSLGANSTARISLISKFEWKEWQLYSLLVGMILVSVLLFWLFFQSNFSDRFWQFPLGRSQPAYPPPEAIWGHGYKEQEHYGL